MENNLTPYNGPGPSYRPGTPIVPPAPDLATEEDTRINPRRSRETARTEIEKDRDRLLIADMYMNRHMTQIQIAVKLGLSQPQVSNDLAFLKKQWKQDARTVYSDAAQEQLDLLDEAAQLFRQAFARSVVTADQADQVDIGQPDGEGKTKTVKSIRTRRAKPYSVAAAMGLVRIAKTQAEITGTIKQAGTVEVSGEDQNNPLAGLTFDQRVERLGNMILDAAARAREKGLIPPLPSKSRLHESGESQAALPPGSPETAPHTPNSQLPTTPAGPSQP